MKKNTLLALTIVFLAACSLPQRGLTLPAALAPQAPQAWIDAPLNNMHIPLAPYEVVFHATDNSGVTGVELSINGQVVALPGLSQPGGKLVTVKYAWVPVSSGEYLLQARLMNSSGAWSDSALARVLVGELTPTPTDVDTLTPTPVITATPTQTSTPNIVPDSFGVPVLSTHAFQYQKDCVPVPDHVTLQVTFSDPSPANSVLFFFRLRNTSTNAYTGWNDGLWMSKPGGGNYQVTISWTDLIADLPSLHGAVAEFQYQFVAFGPRNAVLLRSAVFTDISMSPCH
jgi:hypothetical protein